MFINWSDGINREGRGSRKRVLCQDDFTNHCLPEAAPLPWPGWQAHLLLKWVPSLLFQRDKQLRNTWFVFTLLYNNQSWWDVWLRRSGLQNHLLLWDSTSGLPEGAACESWEALCLFPVCVSEFNVFKKEGGGERSKLKERNSALSFTKASPCFLSDGRIVSDFTKKI